MLCFLDLLILLSVKFNLINDHVDIWFVVSTCSFFIILFHFSPFCRCRRPPGCGKRQSSCSLARRKRQDAELCFTQNVSPVVRRGALRCSPVARIVFGFICKRRARSPWPNANKHAARTWPADSARRRYAPPLVAGAVNRLFARSPAIT